MRVLSVESKKRFFTLKIIVYTLKLFGLAPFWGPNKSWGQLITIHNFCVQAFRSSKIGAAYNILLLIPVINISTSMINEIIGYALTVHDIIVMANQIGASFTACVVLIHWGLQQKKAIFILNRLLEIDLGLNCVFEKQPFNKRTFTFLIIHLVFNVFLYGALCYPKINMVDISIQELLLTFLKSLPNWIVYWFIFEYSAILSLVANDVEVVNGYLMNFKEIGNCLFPRSFQNRRTSPSPIQSISRELASRKLLHYHDIRMKLYKLCGDIEEFFSLPILFCVANCFVSVFCGFYWMCLAARQIDMFYVGVAVPILVTLMLMSPYPVVSLALNVTRIRREAQLTRQIVDRLLEVAIRGEIISKLELLSRQLLHENISFTAYGFFSLDSGLLLSILGGTATYFIAMMSILSVDTPTHCEEYFIEEISQSPESQNQCNCSDLIHSGTISKSIEME